MPDQVKIYHKDGTSAEMDSVDARRALQEHPSEWSTTPPAKDTAKKEEKAAAAADAQAEAARRADAEAARRAADKKLAEQQAERDAEAARILKEQEEKARADAAAAGSNTAEPVDPPITNDGLKVGHIPSEVPALEPKAYVAKHRGGGSYSVLDADGNEVLEKMSKEDAEAFNGMADAEKAEYVKAETTKG